MPRARSGAGREPLAAKVPDTTASFWLIKLLTTGMGEAAADYLARVNILLAAVVGLFGFVIAMRWQFRVRTYVHGVYWFAVVMVAVFGTMGADALHIVFKVPYLASTLACAVALLVIFRVWYRVEGTLSIHSIVTRQREAFYWLAVLATFAMGTAVGDLTATTFKLGFLGAVVLFAVLITLPAIGWWRLRLNAVVAFWIAYVLTRPLGASIADWLGKPHSFGHGLGYGDGTVAAISSLAIIAAVTWVAMRRTGIQGALPSAVTGLGGRDRMLYHYTSHAAWLELDRSGELMPAALQVSGVDVRNAPPVIWLTDDPDPGRGNDHGLGSTAAHAQDRRAIRITVSVTDAMRWPAFAYVQRLPRRVRASIDERGGGLSGRWWVSTAPIPSGRWVSITDLANPQDTGPREDGARDVLR